MSTPDRALVQSASEFVALHHQLVEELPFFLEGYGKILDLAMEGFARAQARYFREVAARLERFKREWMLRSSRRGSSPRKGLKREPGSGSVAGQGRRTSVTSGAEEEDRDERSGRGIVKIWREGWAPYSEAMEHFQITRPGKSLVPRLPDLGSRDIGCHRSRVWGGMYEWKE